MVSVLSSLMMAVLLSTLKIEVKYSLIWQILYLFFLSYSCACYRPVKFWRHEVIWFLSGRPIVVVKSNKDVRWCHGSHGNLSITLSRATEMSDDDVMDWLPWLMVCKRCSDKSKVKQPSFVLWSIYLYVLGSLMVRKKAWYGVGV